MRSSSPPPAPLRASLLSALRAAAPLTLLIAVCTAIELVLTGADFGLWGQLRLRQTAYEWGGFWPGLLDGWQSNYTSQPYVMFLSYAVLHGGALHLAVNMVTLWSLGQAVIDRVGAVRFMVIYLGTALSGAACFGLLADTIRPMVGASGALFGLAGALLAWGYIDRFTARLGLWPVLRLAALLIAMNLAMYWALDGQIAWQTHLGGFIAGWILATLVDPRSRDLG